MHNKLKKLTALIEFIIAAILLYTSLVAIFSSLLINIILIIVGTYILLQCLGEIDEIEGFGKHKNKPSPNNEDGGINNAVK